MKSGRIDWGSLKLGESRWLHVALLRDPLHGLVGELEHLLGVVLRHLRWVLRHLVMGLHLKVENLLGDSRIDVLFALNKLSVDGLVLHSLLLHLLLVHLLHRHVLWHHLRVLRHAVVHLWILRVGLWSKHLLGLHEPIHV